MSRDNFRRDPTAKTVQRSAGMRRKNLSTVLAEIAGGAVARAEIVQRTGMSPATVTNLVGQLLELGLVRELEAEPLQMGRPRVPVAINATGAAAIGIHVGPRTSGVSVMSLDGNLLAGQFVSHEGLSPARLAVKVGKAATKLAHGLEPGVRVLGTGLATAGHVDRSAGTVQNPAVAWSDVPLRRLFEPYVPGPVILEQNVRASASAQLLFGAGREHDDFAVLVVAASTTGLADVIDRKVRSGATHSAGTVGHLRVTDEPWAICTCGRTGCLDAVATDDAVLDRAKAIGIRRTNDMDAMVKLATRDQRAERLLHDRAAHIGVAAASVIDLLDPPRLILLGTIAEQPAYHASVARALDAASMSSDRASERLIIPTDAIAPLHLAEGAAAPVIERVLADPYAAVSSAVA